MTKRVMYNGQIKWFKNVRIPSLLTRKINNDGSKEIVLTKDSENVEETEVIRQLNKYKENYYYKNCNQINEGNVLFRLKCNKKLFINDNANRINKYRVICQSEDLANYNKNSKGKSSKALIEKALLEFDESKLLNINEFTFNDTLIKVFPKQKDNNFKKSDEGKAVLVEVIDPKIASSRNRIVTKMIYVNKNLYKILDRVIKKVEKYKSKYLDTNFWKENIFKILKNECNELSAICNELCKVINYDDRDFVDSYLVIEKNEVKILFLNQIRNIDDLKIQDLLIKYLYDFLLDKDIFKKIDVIDLKQDKYYSAEEKQNRAIRTYITKDKHSDSEAKKDVYKELIDRYLGNEGLLLLDINTILEKNNYHLIFNEIIKSFKEGKGIIDNKLFGKYKELYNDNCLDITSTRALKKDTSVVIEKFLLREIYRYSKGRIRKLINNSSYLKIMKKSDYIIANCNSEENRKSLNIKIEKHIKSNLLNHILYEGKLVHEGLSRNSNSFDEFHALDTLFQEVLVLLSSVNYELNKDLLNIERKIKNEDADRKEEFFDYLDEKMNEGKMKEFKFDNATLYNFGFIDCDEVGENELIKGEKEFKKYLEYYINECYNLRSKIIHAKQINGSKSIIKGSECNHEYYKKLDCIIKRNRIDDEKICKFLNFNYVFKDKKDIIMKINDISFEYDNTLVKYMPSFNKIIPKLRKRINIIDYDDQPIIENAVFYLFKVIYNKEISYENSDFIKKIIKRLEKNEKTTSNNKKKNTDDIIEYYKRVQQKSAQGSYGGIRKYQNMIVDEFIEYATLKYEILLDYSNVKNLKQSIQDKEEEIDLSKEEKENCVIKTSTVMNDSGTVETELEFIIFQSLLLVEPTIANMILNRINATSIWLSKNTNESDVELLRCLDNLYEKGSVIVGMKKQRYLLYQGMNQEEKQHKLLVQEKRKILDNMICEIFNDFSNNGGKVYNYDYIKVLEEGKLTDELSKLDSKDKSAFIKKFKEIRKLDIKVEIENLEKNGYAKTAFDEYNKNLKMIINKIDNELIKERYSQGKFDDLKDENLIFKHEYFNVITKNQFELIFDSYYKNKINNHDLIECDQNLIDTNKKVDNTLSILSSNIKGKSKNFRNQIVDLIKEDNRVFKKYLGNDYKNFDKFEKDYKNKVKYLKQENLLNFRFASLFYEHLLLINYKLMLQIYKFERDVHYFVRGLEQIDNKYRLYINCKPERSVAYRIDDTGLTRNHYTWNDKKAYLDFKNYCKWFEIPIADALKNEEESIRNYIAHFHLLRKLFNKEDKDDENKTSNQAIIDKIYEVNEFMSYRTLYNNGAIKSSLEVLKKNVAIDYARLGECFDSSNKILELISPISSTPLELESQYHEYGDFLKYWLQFKKAE